MALLHSAPPADGHGLLVRHLVRAMRANRHGGPLQGRPAVSEPHPVYQIAAADVEAGTALQSAQHVSWRYFVQVGGEAVGTASLGIEDDGSLHFAGFQRGAAPDALIRAVHAAEALDHLRERDRELRGFQIPEIHVMGLWLHAPRFDLFFPAFATDESGVEAGKVYTANDLFGRLHAHATDVGQRPVLDEL